MNSGIPYFGESLALLTAMAWAVAVILFKKSGETAHPIALNTYKNILAAVLIIPTLYLFGETLFLTAPTSEYLLLLASGALGIGISDTLFFIGLNRLGAGMISIIECLYSPFIIGLSFLWLRERLSVWQLLGVILIISAVLTASSRKGRAKIARRDFWIGLTCSVSALLTMAVGIVMIKPLLNKAPLLWATEVRLIGGLSVLLLVLGLHRKRQIIIKTILTRRNWKYTFYGSFMGAYVSMILWLGGMKYTDASVAAALNQTTNIFTFILAAIFLKEIINRQRTVGIILGFLGAVLVTFN